MDYKKKKKEREMELRSLMFTEAATQQSRRRKVCGKSTSDRWVRFSNWEVIDCLYLSIYSMNDWDESVIDLIIQSLFLFD